MYKRQLQRLEWKTNIITALETEYAKDTTQHPIQIKNLPENITALRGTLSGTYLFDKEINLIPRSHDDQPGKDVITPLQLNDGTTILINRGWAPLNWENKAAYKNPVTLTGLLKPPPTPNRFTPSNVPEKNIWYHVKLNEVKQSQSLNKLTPYIFNLETSTAQTQDTYPKPITHLQKPNNNHQQYAIFWFTMAGALILIFLLRFVKKP